MLGYYITKYVKTSIVEAVVFDGTQAMIDQFSIIKRHDDYGIKTMEGLLRVRVGDYLVTGVEGEHWAVNPRIFDKTYKELPDIPEGVTEILKYAAENKINLWNVLEKARKSVKKSMNGSYWEKPDPTLQWIWEHQNTLSIIWNQYQEPEKDW